MVTSIFSNLYWQLTKVYGQQLWFWLAGFDCDNNEGSRPDLFVLIGIVTLLVTGLLVFLFYFSKFERFKNWVSWLVVLLFAASINFFFGFGYTNNQRQKMNDWAIYGIDNVECPSDEEVTVEQYSEDNYESEGSCSCEQLVPVDGAVPLVSVATCWQFGLANFIVSAITFFILSIIFKRFARGGVRKHSPWRSLWP